MARRTSRPCRFTSAVVAFLFIHSKTTGIHANSYSNRDFRGKTNLQKCFICRYLAFSPNIMISDGNGNRDQGTECFFLGDVMSYSHVKKWSNSVAAVVSDFILVIRGCFKSAVLLQSLNFKKPLGKKQFPHGFRGFLNCRLTWEKVEKNR